MRCPKSIKYTVDLEDFIKNNVKYHLSDFSYGLDVAMKIFGYFEYPIK